MNFNDSSKQSYDIEVYIDNPDRSNGDNVRVIRSDSIISMEITESIFTLLPKIDIVISDRGNLIDRTPILDQDILYVHLNDISYRDETSIDVKFTINSFNAKSVVDNKGNIITISGYLASSNMFSPYHYNAFRGSSDEVIKKVLYSTGLKFRSNTKGYEDIIWYQNSSNYTFIKHISERSYNPSDAIYVYGDTEGYINYNSLKHSLSQEIKYTAKYNLLKMQSEVLLKNEEHIMYYDRYDVLNNTTTFNMLSNYGGVRGYYNLEEYVTDTLYTVNSNTDYLNIYKDYVNTSSFYHNDGILAEKKLRDTIYKGMAQNSFVTYNLLSNTISINIRNTTKVKLMDKVDLNIETPYEKNRIVEPYSGEYIIGSISRSIIKDGNPGYCIQVLLCRNGINKTEDMFSNYNRIE